MFRPTVNAEKLEAENYWSGWSGTGYSNFTVLLQKASALAAKSQMLLRIFQLWLFVSVFIPISSPRPPRSADPSPHPRKRQKRQKCFIPIILSPEHSGTGRVSFWQACLGLQAWKICKVGRWEDALSMCFGRWKFGCASSNFPAFTIHVRHCSSSGM